MTKRKVTIQDIANRAQVGVGTVSRVLNDSPDVSEHTRKRVLQAIEDLNYRPSFAARLMRSGKSHIIGFITDEVASTPFAVDIIRGAQSTASHNNKLLLVVNSDWDADVEESAIEALLERGAEGIIYAAMFHHEVTPPAGTQQVPTVLLNCYDANAQYPSIVPDEYRGGYMAAEILTQKGHQRIAFMNLLPTDIPAHIGRLAGFKAGIADAGLTDHCVLQNCENIPENAYLSALDLMQRSQPPTAIFCGTDRIAMGVYNALHELRLRIPDDVAVLGFDNQVIVAEGLKPTLSTIALPHYEMGKWAVEYLVNNLSSLEPVQEKIVCPYIERDSV